MDNESYKEYARERLLKDFKLHKVVYHNGYAAGIYGATFDSNPYLGRPELSILADRWETGRIDGIKDVSEFDPTVKPDAGP